MTLWVVRAGKTGDREQRALEEGYCFVGWHEMPDLKGYKNKDELKAAIDETYPDNSKGRTANHAGQLWTFKAEIKKGDLIALPLKNHPSIAFGKVVGDYEYRADFPEDMRHARKVEWREEPFLRSKIDSDLKYSLGSTLTVFSISRNDAENRIKAMLEGKTVTTKITAQGDEIEDPETSLLSVAAQQISDHLGRHFKGRKMEQLITEILKAKGYETDLCDEGADGGVDILAGGGAMGFAAPFLCVQVKSGDSPVGREVLDQLTGVMQRYNAAHGILVSWGGFKNTVTKEARRDFFKIRLWNDTKIVEELQEVYDLLPKWLQADIPLQKTWVLAKEEV